MRNSSARLIDLGPLKRAPSTDGSDRHQPSSKRRCKSPISSWLETIPSPIPVPHSHSTGPSYRRSRSAPVMSARKKNLVPTPPSSRISSRVSKSSFPAESVSSKATSTSSCTQNPLYRTTNLESNGVFYRLENELLPSWLDTLLAQIRADRNSPPPDIPRWDPELVALQAGTGESDVEDYFKTRVFQKQEPPIACSDKKHMFRSRLPDNPGSDYRISQPVPDRLFGYNKIAFTVAQRVLIANIKDTAIANNEGLIFPFLNIECKGDGPHGGGSLWAATNQCQGGAALCSALIRDLQEQLSECSDLNISPKITPEEAQRNSITFSVAMTGSEARLFVTWNDSDVVTFTQSVETFLVSRAREVIDLRRHVLNIIDWGRSQRLEWLKRSLDNLMEAQRITKSNQLKARSHSPHDGSGDKRREPASEG